MKNKMYYNPPAFDRGQCYALPICIFGKRQNIARVHSIRGEMPRIGILFSRDLDKLIEKNDCCQYK